jgi:hypothetical protein
MKYNFLTAAEGWWFKTTDGNMGGLSLLFENPRSQFRVSEFTGEYR